MTALRKVECVNCGGTFKVEDDPPRELLAESFEIDSSPSDPYRASRLKLKGGPASIAWCRWNCGFCKGESHQSEVAQANNVLPFKCTSDEND